jgi:hypothetical protein
MAVTFSLPSPCVRLRAGVIVLLSLGLWSGPPASVDGVAFAPNTTIVNAAPKITAINATLTVNPDRTAELVETRRVTVLKERAVRVAGQQVATYIDGMETLDLIEAYTQKSDGRRIDVTPDRIFRRDAAIDDDGRYLADQKALTVFYPDLSVGDTVVLTTRLKISSGTFPGHLVTQFLHSSAVRSDKPSLKITVAEDAREIPAPGSTYRIVVPRDMAITVGMSGEGMTTEVTENETTITYTATFGVMPPVAKDDRRMPVERGPYILVSTLRDYEDLGRNYWAAAEPHVKVTPAIQKIAGEITAGIEDRHAQANAISDWVKRNIRYVIVHRGIGRDLSAEPADTILRDRFGECKEHVILMTALLAAKGIESELVLINLGDVGLLPQTATLAFFNHLMVYLPEFDLYDDPTAAKSAFGEMSHGGHGKPVVVMSGRGARVATTPAE